MSEPIQWVYVAGKECAYCKDGLGRRLEQLLESGHGVVEASHLMEGESEGKWPASTIRTVYYRLFSNENISTTPELGGVKSSQKHDWQTPERFVEASREVLETIDLDPASSTEANITVQAEKIYTKEDDGLERDWLGRVFMNPPYGKEGPKFVAKLVKDYEAGNVSEAILLVSAYSTDTKWFQPLLENYLVCFVRGRIKMDRPDDSSFTKPNTAPMGTALVYFGKNGNKFANKFKEFGVVVHKYGKDT